MCTRGALRTMIPPADRPPGRAARERRAERPQGAVRRADRRRRRGRRSARASPRWRCRCSSAGRTRPQSVHNMTRLVDAGMRHGIPVMAVVAVGKELTRDARYFRLACRMCAELGAQFVKAYHVDEGFASVDGVLPGADRHRRRQEAAGARRAADGPRRRERRRGRRRHGPQHLPERRPGRDDRARCAASSTTGSAAEAAFELYQTLRMSERVARLTLRIAAARR